MPGSGGSNPGMMKPGLGDQATTPTTASEGKRTEFVILFIWKEPTPSDMLRGLTAASQDASNQETAAKPAETPLPASSRPRRPKAEPTQPKSK